MKRSFFPLRILFRHISDYQKPRRRPKDVSRPNITRSTLGFDKINTSPMQSMLSLSKKYFVPNANFSEIWHSLEKDATTNIKGISPYNFDALMMTFLRKEKMYDKGQSFLKYLNSVRVPNDITLANYLILAAESKDEQEAFETYSKINKSLLIVPTLLELVVKGMSQTSRWKECLDLIGQLEEIHVPSLMVLASAAFTNTDSDTGKHLIQKVIGSGIEPKSTDFFTWINLIYHLKSSEDIYWLTCQLLVCLRKTEHILILNNALLLRKVLYRWFSMHGSSVTMEMKGECSYCGYKLERPKLSAEEHEELKEVFQARLSQGSETYEQSNPKELKSFLWFLEKSKPYDVVVDGLNVAHGQKDKRPASLAQQLLNVVTQLCEQGAKPLVLGRKHMWFWNKRIMTQVEHKAKCFYADNISADDPFMIYAALYSGPGTLFVTADLLRDHQCLLVDQRKKELFHRWSRSSQVYCTEINGKIEIRHHEQFGVYVQGNWQEGWHIPYEQHEPYKPHVPFWKQKLYWLCANRKPQSRHYSPLDNEEAVKEDRC